MPTRILYVGHSTVLVDMDGVRVLTDPLLRSRVVHLRRVGKVNESALRDIDAVLVSHLHYDHLDIPSLERLGRDVPLVVPRGASRLLEKKGFNSVTELAAGDELQLGALVVRGTPAVHDAGRLPFGTRAQAMGHVIEGTRSVYFAGDTDVFEGIAELAPVDVALVPIWGWGPAIGPGHMNPAEAAEAVRMLSASIAIPIHWGTYFPFQTGLLVRPPAFVSRPAAVFAAEVRARAPDAEVRVLLPGEETTL
ncbi:MAG TPA: MBL fold metallo-hydrolase [Gaiellaceae bacterium]|nr:MBL fold metallo-hydrolase [Gaiellaceae bacterium]